MPRFAAQLEREALRLSRIVADLLDLSRLESGSELTERVRVDAIVREEAERFDDAGREAGVRVIGPSSRRRPRSPDRPATSRCSCAT